MGYSSLSAEELKKGERELAMVLIRLGKIVSNLATVDKLHDTSLHTSLKREIDERNQHARRGMIDRESADELSDLIKVKKVIDGAGDMLDVILRNYAWAERTLGDIVR